MSETAPYGTWPSPFSPESIVADSVRLVDVVARPDGGTWWVEGRPGEGGRQVLVIRDALGSVSDVTPRPFSVRTRVHEYGGSCFCVDGEHAWFSNDADGRVYSQTVGQAPQSLTPAGPWKYADLQLDRRWNRLVCVRETARDGQEPENDLVAVSLEGGAVEMLASGHDFYTAPRVRNDGAALAFLTWDHPNMPWDGTILWQAEVGEGGAIGLPKPVAGGEQEAIFQPQWGMNGELFYVSDRSGWWNLYSHRDGEDSPLLEKSADFGKPYWQFGMSTYGLVDATTLVCSWCEDGLWSLGRLDVQKCELTPIDTDYTTFDGISVAGSTVACLAGAPASPGAIVRIDIASGESQTLRTASALDVTPEHLSIPRSLFFDSGGARVHGFFYPPANASYEGPADERPPLIVIGHGGPTGSTSAVLDPKIQYWTSRGFAVVDVNYRGSTGFGRAYRDALKGGWGVVDVVDCVNAARHLAVAGEVDEHRLIIRGGSAGGFTALAALAFHDVFKAAASYYGIGELEALANDTHKFESRYLDSLIGPYPQMQALYKERSPINHIDGLSCPVVFFQGLEDRVVPPNQAEMMVSALKEKGLPVAYLAFEGEQHGFRQASTIKRTLEAELYFYGKVFGFEPAGEIEAVTIENLT
ncbi:MAG: S9 family peptidase [Chromatiales bacterium]|jgi:dipeptidyl aminopeptidase/acylaminoacyl peptidase|nr:S9 family peptidase [Chromatiales bacterium]